jgi:predicted lipoprotein
LEVDQNGDGSADRLELNIKTPIVPGEAINSATLFVFFEYMVRLHALS